MAGVGGKQRTKQIKTYESRKIERNRTENATLFVRVQLFANVLQISCYSLQGAGHIRLAVVKAKMEKCCLPKLKKLTDRKVRQTSC